MTGDISIKNFEVRTVLLEELESSKSTDDKFSSNFPDIKSPSLMPLLFSGLSKSDSLMSDQLDLQCLTIINFFIFKNYSNLISVIHLKCPAGHLDKPILVHGLQSSLLF